jgi:periplasmic protein CpxP/Spy
MKKLILSAAAFTLLCLGHMTAQTTATAPATTKTQRVELTPEQEASRHATKLASQLGLTDDQKAKIEALDVERINANRPLHEQGKAATSDADKKAARQQVKANNDKFEASVSALLTPEQKTKWEAQRKEAKEKHMEKRKAAGATAQ